MEKTCPSAFLLFLLWPSAFKSTERRFLSPSHQIASLFSMNYSTGWKIVVCFVLVFDFSDCCCSPMSCSTCSSVTELFNLRLYGPFPPDFYLHRSMYSIVKTFRDIDLSPESRRTKSKFLIMFVLFLHGRFVRVLPIIQLAVMNGVKRKRVPCACVWQAQGYFLKEEIPVWIIQSFSGASLWEVLSWTERDGPPAGSSGSFFVELTAWAVFIHFFTSHLRANCCFCWLWRTRMFWVFQFISLSLFRFQSWHRVKLNEFHYRMNISPTRCICNRKETKFEIKCPTLLSFLTRPTHLAKKLLLFYK